MMISPTSYLSSKQLKSVHGCQCITENISLFILESSDKPMLAGE